MVTILKIKPKNLSFLTRLISFSFLNYLDKFIIVIIPIFVLFFTKNKSLYNQLEYVYSLASIIIIATDLGLRNFLLYGYRESKDRINFVNNGVNYFLFINFLYTLTGAVLTCIMFFIGWDGLPILLFVVIRTLYTNIFAFYTVVARLNDKPANAFIISIPINAGTFGLICLFFLLKKPIYLSYLFLTQIVVVSFFFGLTIKEKVWRKLNGFFIYFKEALRYAWPIILNLFLVTIIQNIGKIYAQNMLNENEMTRIAFSQRISMIIQLGHASVVGYLVKHLFIIEGISIDKKIGAIYIVALGISASFSMTFLYVSGIFLNVPVKFNDPVFYVLLLYAIFWCISAFIELYVNKMNKNIYIPIVTSIGFVIFLLIVVILPFDRVMKISLGMMFNSFITMILMYIVISFHKRKYA